MKWLPLCFLLLASNAFSEETPKELSALEFGLDVESIEADKPTLELQLKYGEHLRKLKIEYGKVGNAEAVSDVATELEHLDKPLETEISSFPKLKSLQEAHRARFISLMAERKETLQSLIEHYQQESRKLAEAWKSEGKLNESTLALEASGRFSVHLERPIDYRAFLEKHPADEEPGAVTAAGGALRARGVVAGRVPIDISIANRFDDFVAVEFHSKDWAAIRENGEIISTQPDLNGVENASQVEMNERHAYVVHRNGEVTSVPPDRRIPTDLREVTKISVSHKDVVALTERGWIVGWGESFSTPSLRPPETLTDVVDIALTWGSSELQGFALRADGTVATWGGGDKPIQIPRDLPGIKALDAGWSKLACLTEDGKAVILGPNGYTGPKLPANTPPLTSILARGPIFAGRTTDGNWIGWGGDTMGVTDQINEVGATPALTYKMNGSPQGWGAVLWIENN